MRGTADSKTVVGLVEKIKILGDNAEADADARIDTGATKSSIDEHLATDIGLGRIIKTTFIKSASGSSVRPVVRVRFVIAGREIEEEFTIADRLKMRYPVLIGQNVIKKGFIVDPSKGAPAEDESSNN